MNITIGHTHDADDAFMFYAMLNAKIAMPRLRIDDAIETIADLNRLALSGYYDMSAVSVAMLPVIAGKYELLTVGACMAEERGPVLVRRRRAALNNIAVPALNTTAGYVARIFARDALFIAHPHTDIMAAVGRGEFDAGVIITEEQMMIDERELSAVDLGLWWQQQYQLPLPLGVNVVKSSLPSTVKRQLCRSFQDSIRYALEHEEEALTYALNFGRGIDSIKGREFIKTFVNQYTLSLGDKGIAAIDFFLSRCHEYGLFAELPQIRYI